MGIATCPPTLCQQTSSLPQAGTVGLNDYVMVYDPTLGCAAGGLTLKKIPIENEVLKGIGAPVAPPIDPTENKTWFDTATSQISHYWDAAAAAWKPVVGTFPIIKKCDNSNAVATDKFFTYDKVTSAVAAPANAAAHLLVFPDNGNCPQKLQVPNTCTSVLPAPVGGGVLGVINAAGDIGLVRSSSLQSRVTLGGPATVDLLTTDIYVINTAGTVTLPTPTAGNFCQNSTITIKRTSNDPTVVVRVTAAAGIDSAPGNTIQLGTSSKFGTLSGESATFAYDGATWRIVNSY
jgi:hypothetical protein